MKKVSILMVAALVAVSSATFVGCEFLQSDEPSIQIRFTGYSSTNGKVTVPGDKNNVEVEVQIKAPGKIAEISIKRPGGTSLSGFPKTKDFDPSETMHIEKWTVNREKADGGSEVISFDVTVTDKDKEPQIISELVEITFEQKAGEINAPVTVQLASGMHGDANICFASSTGLVYSSTPANTTLIDFVYFDDLGTHTIASPKMASEPGVLQGKIGSWSTKNATKLQKFTSVTTSQFDAMEDDALIVQHVPNITSESVINLAANNIIGFVTVGGKKGLIKVNSVGSPANTINITVKVQK